MHTVTRSLVPSVGILQSRGAGRTAGTHTKRDIFGYVQAGSGLVGSRTMPQGGTARPATNELFCEQQN